MNNPIIALVGPPNAGKSTLFNRLTHSRQALTADFPGLTRDRHYGSAFFQLPKSVRRNYLLIDTGGFEPETKSGIFYEMAKQTRQAILEADLIFFVIDGREPLHANLLTITADLRRSNKPLFLVINKMEGCSETLALSEFSELGITSIYAISAAHGIGIASLMQAALATCLFENQSVENQEKDSVKITIVGRPNVGKSTLANALIGKERMIVFDLPGTTRDAVDLSFEYQNKTYTLIDTAGIRRRGKIFEAIEKFSVIKTLQAITRAHIVIFLLDAQQDISEQDAHIAQFICESGRALVIGVNKWDGLNEYQKMRIRADIERKLKFLDFAATHFISAKECFGLDPLMHSVQNAYVSATASLSTPKLTRVLHNAVSAQAPKRQGLIRPKLRYAHQGGSNPPIIVIHGNALLGIDQTYKRYLEKYFRKQFALLGTPLRIELRSGKNPYIAIAK